MQLEGNFPEPEERSRLSHPLPAEEGRGEGRPPGAVARPAGGFPRGAGLRPAELLPPLPAGEGRGEGRRVSVMPVILSEAKDRFTDKPSPSLRAPGDPAGSPASSPSRISVGAGLAPAPLSDPPNHATLHSSFPSLPAVTPVHSVPNSARAGRAPARFTPAAGTPVIVLDSPSTDPGDSLIDEPELDDLVPFLEPAR